MFSIKYHLLSFLLEFLDGSLINTTAFVDEVASGCRLSRIDVTDDDNVDVNLFGTHGGFKLECKREYYRKRKRYKRNS